MGGPSEGMTPVAAGPVPPEPVPLGPAPPGPIPPGLPAAVPDPAAALTGAVEGPVGPLAGSAFHWLGSPSGVVAPVSMIGGIAARVGMASPPQPA